MRAEYDSEERDFNEDLLGKRLRIVLRKTIRWGVGLWMAAGFSCAAVTARANDPDPPAPEESWEQMLIRRNIAISKFFDGIADGLDLFLAGDRITTQRNETSVRLENSTYVRDGEGVKNGTGVGVNLKLPNLEKYWNLKFTSYDEQQEKRDVRQSYLRQNPRENNYGATLGLFQKLGNVRTTFEPRIELQNPLKISHSIAFESVLDMKTYRVNPKLELFATPTKGTGIFLAANWHIPLQKRLSLTLINEAEYLDKLHQLSVSNGFSFGHIISSRSSLSYDLIFGSNNRTSYHLESYVAGITWTHLIYRKILDYRVTPYLDFEKAFGFKAKPGLTFTLGVTF